MEWRPHAPDGHLRWETDRAILTIYTSEPPFWWVVRLRTTGYTRPPDREGYADTLDEAKRAAETALDELTRPS